MEIFAFISLLYWVFLASTIVNEGSLTSYALFSAPPTLDVTKFGAVGDGKADDTKAFVATWQAACNQKMSNAKITVPQGKTYLLSQIEFGGPCKSPSITFEILGTIISPSKSAWTSETHDYWLFFYQVNNLNVVGNEEGVIDGRGSSWWPPFAGVDANLPTAMQIDRPTALKFSNCNNLHVSGLKHINSQRNHVSISGCNGVNIEKLHIIAPEKSPNTDGIDIGSSTSIRIHDCTIETGDDCIAINGGTSNANITHVACGPGHGISVGSLGLNGAHDEVRGIHVNSCSFKGTQNGVRIKTWQGGSGFARDISFSDITLIAADNPIIIDQFYCNGKVCQPIKASAVKISDVTYTGIKGTTICKYATINFSCSNTVPCTNIIMNNINIAPFASNRAPFSHCINARVTAHLTEPPVNCQGHIQALKGDKK